MNIAPIERFYIHWHHCHQNFLSEAKKILNWSNRLWPSNIFHANSLNTYIQRCQIYILIGIVHFSIRIRLQWPYVAESCKRRICRFSGEFSIQNEICISETFLIPLAYEIELCILLRTIQYNIKVYFIHICTMKILYVYNKTTIFILGKNTT